MTNSNIIKEGSINVALLGETISPCRRDLLELLKLIVAKPNKDEVCFERKLYLALCKIASAANAHTRGCYYCLDDKAQNDMADHLYKTYEYEEIWSELKYLDAINSGILNFEYGREKDYE